MFGSYVESNKYATFTNNMKPQTYACIVLGPSGNLQGSQKVFDIYTGQTLKSRTTEDFPMPDRVVRRMSYWVKKYNSEEYGKKIQFKNQTKEQYDWENDEFKGYEGLVEDAKLHPNIASEITAIDIEI